MDTRARILVVDDEQMIRETLALVLSRDYEVVPVASGQECLDLVLDENDRRGFEIIICDVMMPGVNGFDVHAALLEKNPELARNMIFITGGVSNREKALKLNSLPNLKVEKPFSPKVLREGVEKLLAQSKKTTRE